LERPINRSASRAYTHHGSTERNVVSEQQLDEMGPIDYMVLEWAGDTPVTGEVMPLLLDLVDRGVIRILA
jgi:hypothetical protein